MAEEITHSDEKIRDVLQGAKTLNVLGMKDSGAAYSVPFYMKTHGYEIRGINPKLDQLDGVTFVASLDEATPADIVVVFRRSEALAGHLDDFLNSGAKTIWFQLGIRDDEVAAKLVESGFDVVQDRCIKVEHARLVR